MLTEIADAKAVKAVRLASEAHYSIEFSLTWSLVLLEANPAKVMVFIASFYRLASSYILPLTV
jgi:hypothetical protein